MNHVEKEGTIKDDQNGGRRGRQAQSAVINKLMYYHIQHQIAEEAVFIDKDARSCFDRLIPQLVAIENAKLGSDMKAGKYMVDILDSQQLHFRTGHGLTKKCVTKTHLTPKYGAGQGIGWSGQACTATLNTISTAMEDNCNGMIFVNPCRTIRLKTFGDYFVDDTSLGTNKKGKKKESVMIQAQHNDQKHSLYLHTSGGKNAIEKCLWYKVTFRFKNGKAIMKRIYEEPGILRTKSSHSSKPETVPRYEVNQSHKTLGCWVNPMMDQKKQKEDLIIKCEKWVQRVAASYLRPHEKLLAYDSVLLRQMEYRLVTACFTFTDCQEIMKSYMKVICHGFHIHRNFNRNLVCASARYGGLDVLHLYDVAGLTKTKFFMKHMQLNDKTGKLMRISMEYTQLEIGTKKLFYEYKYHEWKELITPTWITHLWDYWSCAEVQLEMTKMWNYSSSRKNDIHIMDIFYEKVKNKKTLHKLNVCRIQLKVITLSDITALDGTVVLPEILEGINHRGSDLNWPRKEVPEEWWKTWSTFMRSYILPYAKQKKLGKMKFSTHQKMRWKLYENDILKCGDRVFTRSNSRSSQYVKYFLTTTTKTRGRGMLVDVQKVSKTQVMIRSQPIEIPISMATRVNLSLTPIQVDLNKLMDKKKKTTKKKI
jgi:hypothetical protein